MGRRWLRLRAPAKINLTLEVLGRRPDGYHEVATVLQTVGLWDEVEVEPAPALSLECQPPDLATPGNLAFQAGCLLKEAMGVPTGARIRLRKGIPVSAGLGGGSADAAAVLWALNRLWGLGLDREALARLGAQVGADVPFFLVGGTALARGRGEEVVPLPPLPPTWVVLLVPPDRIPNKTTTLYRALRPEHFTDGGRTRALVQALRDGQPPSPSLFTNAFEPVAGEVFPSLPRARRALQEAGAVSVHLSGSGPTLFAPVEGEAQGRALLSSVRAQGFEASLVPTVPAGPDSPFPQETPDPGGEDP